MKQNKQTLLRWGSHILFWAAIILLLTFFYGHFTRQLQEIFWFVCLQMPVVIATVYFINYRLVKRFLLPGRWFKFILYFFYTLVVSVYLQLSVVVYSLIILADYHYERINHITSDGVFLVFGTYFVVFLATSVKMLKHWLESKNQIQKLESERLEAELKLRESELRILRGQIQPHFLFNTLNNLYGLALEKSEVLPKAILQLSDILDSLLYRTEKESISINEELRLIDNYIKLEHLRFEDRLQVELKAEGDLAQVQIPPFAIFTLVENAFKHGFAEDSGLLHLKMEIAVLEDCLHVFVVNSVPAVAEKKAGGIGLQNLRKRLQHAYGNYELTTKKNDDFFEASLKIELKSKK